MCALRPASRCTTWRVPTAPYPLSDGPRRRSLKDGTTEIRRARARPLHAQRSRHPTAATGQRPRTGQLLCASHMRHALRRKTAARSHASAVWTGHRHRTGRGAAADERTRVAGRGHRVVVLRGNAGRTPSCAAATEPAALLCHKRLGFTGDLCLGVGPSRLIPSSLASPDRSAHRGRLSGAARRDGRRTLGGARGPVSPDELGRVPPSRVSRRGQHRSASARSVYGGSPADRRRQLSH